MEESTRDSMGESSWSLPDEDAVSEAGAADEERPTVGRHRSMRSQAIVREALQRSDSVLSQDEDDEEEDPRVPSLPGRAATNVRASSIAYMEEASMEVVPPVDGSPVTRIYASGRLGRRRTLHDSAILVDHNPADRLDHVEEEAPPEAETMPDMDPNDTMLLDRTENESFVVENGHLDDASRIPPPATRRPTERDFFASARSLTPPILPPASPKTMRGRSAPIRNLWTPEKALDVLETASILSTLPNDEPAALHALFVDVCVPRVDFECASAVWQSERRYAAGEVPSPLAPVALPDQPIVRMTESAAVALLTCGYPSSPALLRIETDFASAFLRLLIRILSHESEMDYHRSCLAVLEWKHAAFFPLDLSESTADPDHVTRRPHLLYSSARLQCNAQWQEVVGDEERPALAVVWNLWERASANVTAHDRLLAPLARLLGLLAIAGMTPRILRGMLAAVHNPLLPCRARLAVARAVRTAASGSSRPALFNKLAPKHFFLFGGSHQGVTRTITGLSTWPFRNDFGMAVWFRAERFDKSRYPVLLSVRSDDGGGIDVSLVPLGRRSSDACTVQVSVFDSGKGDVPVRSVNVSGCVLLPRVWYHLAVRHTRSRLKGVFSLSTRQQLSIMLDGKVMLTDALVFPKIAGADEREDSATLLLQAGLRRSTHISRFNLFLTFGADFDGQTGSLYLFNDSVSDASFRALYEATGGTTAAVKRRASSIGDSSWDSRRSDIVKKSRVLDVNITNDDAEEIVLSQRRLTAGHKKVLDDADASVVDLAAGDEQDEAKYPPELQKTAFGSKVFLAWDPRRSLGWLALELHLGAHISMDQAHCWSSDATQDVIGSLGGVQALIPLFRALLVGDSDRVPSHADQELPSDDSEIASTAVAELLLLLRSFVQDHSDNARELLRCGGVDVIEQLVYSYRRSQSSNWFQQVNQHPGLARQVVESLLDLRSACAHYVGLETKVFSRLLFNIPLWLGGCPASGGVALRLVLLPVLASITKANPEKVRDCVGVRDMVHALKENLEEYRTVGQILGSSVPGDAPANGSPSSVDNLQVGDVLLGMIFEVLSSGASLHDLSPFLNFLAYNLESEWKDFSENGSSASSMTVYRRERQRLIANSSTALLFLLKIRPLVPGLFESFAQCCGTVQGGVAWLLSAMVNSHDDTIRSLGVRCVAAYLDVTAKGPDSPLSVGSQIQPPELDAQVSTDVKSSVSRLGLLAKGLAAMGPGVRSMVIPPSKLTARVVVKLLWHLLKTHRYSLGSKTHNALLWWICDDEGIMMSSITSVDYLQTHLIAESKTAQPGYRFCMEWADSILAETGNIVGRSLRNPLAIGAILRLLRFLDCHQQALLLSDLLTLSRASRKSTSLLSSLPDWQPCLFQLASDLLEAVAMQAEGSVLDVATNGSAIHERNLSEATSVSARLRLDQCLQLYSTLLGHLVREGGDKALEAVETTASLQRVCVNGHDVLLLVLSSLCANLFDFGTLLEMGSISAQDWEKVDLEQDSLPLKQSARLVTDAILSNGTKGLDMTTAVRSWRCLRHLCELCLAVVTESRFGSVDLFDYINQHGSALDSVSGGLHGIRLPDSRLSAIGSEDYLAFVAAAGSRVSNDGEESQEYRREVDRRLCVFVSAQMLTLLDAFIFPDALDEALPASQLHGLALVRNSEPRLGTSQGPLVSSAIRLSLVLLALLEPCSVKLLQCASRMRCLLYWSLELIRESSTQEIGAKPFMGATGSLDRLIVAMVMHCHRTLGRCSALRSEIESSTYDKYFQSRESQKKHYRRLLRVALELREVVSTAFRGRTEVLRLSLSSEAYEALRVSLEGNVSPGAAVSKETVIKDFLSSHWVTGFQDVETRADVVVPEQLSMDSIPLSSDHEPSPSGFTAIDRLAQESTAIVTDFEKALDGCFKEYLESQRKWAETDAVRDLEFDGDSTAKRLSDKYKSDSNDVAKAILLRRAGADNRWRGISRKAIEPWAVESHWKLARYTDRLGRRTLLVQNRNFDDHLEASYELMLGKEREREQERRAKLLEEDLSEVMKRNAAAFTVSDSTELSGRDDASSNVPASDTESVTDVESLTDGESSLDPTSGDGGYSQISVPAVDIVPEESEYEEEWDKIDTEEIKDVDAEGDIDAWAKTFIWSDSESVVARFEHVMIVTLQAYVEGKLLLTTHGLYFHQVGDEINVMTKQPIESSDNDARDRRWRLTRLTEIHGRRYMLRPQALELFFSDSHELFLNFPGGNKERERFHAKLRNSCKSLNPKTVFRKTRLTELWKKRKISNFEYLMALNRMAGRSFNDITQYPVFPWILADYTSETIDLEDSRVFRDLSKPIGALNPDRLAQLLERYKDLELFGFSEAEKFLYGSHYSSPGIVLHFLIRQEPFTTMAIELQSGRFDCPDRLFFDIASSWNGCMTSSSDMKELIPEFFCLPEMFLNTNHFPLGRTQSGRAIDSVGLPAWAKGSPYEFVRIHRLALESEFVSQNLHHWIDLIFGYKQRGPEAEAAHNIFHHLSYEGSVDLDKIADEVDRQAAESHIQNFGQTPSQLSALDPHPSRYGPQECWRPLIYDLSVPKRLRCHTYSKQFANKRSEHAKGAVLKIHVLSETIFAVYADLSVGTYRWFPTSTTNRLRMDKLRPLPNRELSSSREAMKRGSAIPEEKLDSSCRAIGNWSFAITIGGLAKEELRRKAVLPSGRLMATTETTLAGAETSALLVSCGFWDDTVKVHSSEGLRYIASETGGHRGPVRCLAIGQDGGLMVTGGQDGTCRVWVVEHPDMAVALSDGYVQTALGASNDGDRALTCCHVLWGHDTPITCLDLNSDLDAVVSGSQSGLVCVHTIKRGEFIRSFPPPALSDSAPAGSVTRLALDTSGNLVVNMQDDGLHTFTVNAVRLCSVDAGEQINDMRICSNGEFLVTGGMRCQVLIRTVVDLNVCAMLDLSRHGPIRCIALTPDDLNPTEQFLFIGSDDGMITIVDEDPLKTDESTPL